jgi:hypothetical protein
MRLRIRYTIRNGCLIAIADIPQSTLTVRVSMSADEAAELLERYGVLRDDEIAGLDYVGASFWKRMSRRLKKTIKKVAASKVFKAISAVVKNPIFQALIPPQVMMAINIAGQASKAIGGVVKGNSDAARAALAKAVDAARAGDKTMAQGLTLAAQATGIKPSELIA